MAQRYGSGYNSCINLNNWAHLFSPNSESAQQGALNCFDHWNRDVLIPEGGNGTIGFTNSRRSINTTRDGDLDAYARTKRSADGPSNDKDPKLLEKALLVLIAALTVWFFIIRK